MRSDRGLPTVVKGAVGWLVSQALNLAFLMQSCLGHVEFELKLRLHI